jgi:hypothetical protein
VKPLPIGVALAVLLTASLPGQDLPPWVLLLARVKQHARATFEHIPDSQSTIHFGAPVPEPPPPAPKRK